MHPGSNTSVPIGVLCDSPSAICLSAHRTHFEVQLLTQQKGFLDMTYNRIQLAWSSAIILALFGGGLFGGGSKPKPAPVAAWVNKWPITKEQVRTKTGWILKQIKLTPKSKQYKAFLPKIRAKALSMLIDREVALGSKKAQGIAVTADDEEARLKVLVDEKGLGDLDRLKSIIEAKGVVWKDWLAEMKGRITILRIKAVLAKACALCTKQEAEALYAKDKARFQSGGRVKVSIILLDPRKLDETNFRRFVTATTDRVRGAVESEWLACSKDFSSGPNAETGGHWDWTERSDLPEGVGKTAGWMKPEDVVKVWSGDFCYILRLNAVEPKKQLSFDEARKAVEAEVMRCKAAAAWSAWLAKEKRKADIRIRK